MASGGSVGRSPGGAVNASELYSLFRACGSKFFTELSEDEQRGWDRIAEHLDKEVEAAYDQGYDTGARHANG